jgi:hypothetical protein
MKIAVFFPYFHERLNTQYIRCSTTHVPNMIVTYITDEQYDCKVYFMEQSLTNCM